MADTLENQIWQALSEYARRRMSLDAFQEWFVPLSFDIEESGEPGAIELAHHVYGILAEASSAGWTEEELHEELSVPFVVPPYDVNVVGDSSPFPVAKSIATEDASNRAEAA